MAETNQFLIAHGLTILFVVVFAEQIGLPIPALPWLLAAGALSATGKFNPILAVSVTVMACVIANTFWFYLGRYRGRQILKVICRISLELDSCVRRTETMFARHGDRALLLAKFVPGLGTVAPPLAGMSGIRLGRFIFVDALGSLAFAICGVGLGYLFSNQLEQIVAALTHIGNSALILLVVMVALYVSYKFWQRQRLLRELRAARITANELSQQLAAGEKPVILDLRSKSELKKDPSIIRGAIHVDFEELVIRAHEIPQNRDIIVYCSCPNEVTSARFALLLQKKGHTRIRPLQGGIEAWRKLNYPMEAWSSTVTITATSSADFKPAGNETKTNA